jgi:hypothetical protein
MRDNEHISALERLKGARAEQKRPGEDYDSALGTSSELDAQVRLAAADEQVSARQTWLHWVDDERHRGLNAGPFSLLEEQLATASPTSEGPPSETMVAV